MRKIAHRMFRTNRGIRIIVGLLLGSLVLIQWLSPSGASRENVTEFRDIDPDTTLETREPDLLDRVLALSGKDHEPDHVGLLDLCIEEWKKKYSTSTYTCTFTKQETINGRLTSLQVIDVKYRPAPFSVAMKWTKNAPMGDCLVYVEGKYKDKSGRSQMIVRLANSFFRKLIGSVKKLPDCKDAMKNTLKPCTEFGLLSSLENLRVVYELGHKRQECTDRYVRVVEVDGRNCVEIERILDGTHPEYPAYKTLAYIDLEYLVPLQIDGYDRDGKRNCIYKFSNIKFNAGLKDKDFTPEANDIKVK
jgi:hypothetical protein